MLQGSALPGPQVGVRVVGDLDDASDLEDLYRSDRAALVRTAVLLVTDRGLAEDIVHDSFERFASRARPDVVDVHRYVRRMVVNECYAVMKKQRREAPTEVLPAGLHFDSRLAELHDAILRLTPRRRTALVLRYLDDLPVNEIADLMGARPSTISSLIHRALADLQEVLR